VSLAAFGSIALWGAIVACGASIVGSILSRPRLSRSALAVGSILAFVSVGTLWAALLIGDFSLDYVVRTTSLTTPWPYRFSALWGAMEGSLLFYATLSLGFGIFALARLDDRVESGSRPIIASVGGGLLLLTALVADPFVTMDIPAVDGEGLLAILQHPAMVYHPPILYLGLTSLLVPFAITMDAIRRGSIDGAWIRTMRRWLLFPWTLLTLGMVAGANWAYVELGWGGFWAWDPVENTSLMPWLAVTVFLHTSRIQIRDGRLARWNAWFGLIPFVLTVLGVYLTRSGVTGSVHAFAESDDIGRILLTLFLLLVVLVGWSVLRVPKGRPWPIVRMAQRDSWLAGEGSLIATALVFVFIGSAYPAYISVFAGDRTSVDSSYFATLILPLALLIVVGAGLGMRTSWLDRNDDLTDGARWLAVLTFLGGILATLLLGWSGTWGFLLLTLAIGAAALILLDLALRRPSGRLLVGHLAHLGIALVLIGAGGSSLGDEFRGGMAPGDVVEVGGYEVRLDRVETGDDGRFIFVAADLTLLRDGDVIDTVTPQIRAYESQPLPVPEPVLRSTPREDIVFAISRVTQDASGVEVSVFVRPLVFWVWAGGLLIAIAGVAGLIGRGGAAGVPHRAATAERPDRGATNAG
jgi:cytochrome c-type biogenesis protein CcmF